ncbi:MAG: CARDB domain-containing protein, partial [Candidatus Thermoplasmatota archaeon]
MPTANDTECGYDITLPTILYNYPSPGGVTIWYNADPGSVIDIDFQWIAYSPLDYAQYKIGAGSWIDIFTADQFSDYTTNWGVLWIDLAEGENQISIRVADVAGNVWVDVYAPGSQGFLYRKDTGKPTVSITPLPKYNNSDFTVSWSGSDTISGVKYYTVQYSENNTTSWQNWPGFVETLATSGLWLISNTTEGCIVYFRVIVYDNALNTNTDATYTTKDTIKPISNILIPEEGYATNTTIQIEGNCSDEKSGVNRTEIKISWKDNGTVYKDWHNTTLASNYTWWNYSFLPLNDANFTIYIKAVDNASNVQVNISINITYDCTPPSASQLISPASGITLDINLPTFAWKYSTDTLSGMAYYNIQVSNKSDFVYLIYEYDTLINSSTPEYTFPDDTYYWKVFAVDRAGNVNESEIAWFNISVGAPRIDKFCINNDALYTNSTLVMLTINIAYEPVNFKMRLSNDKSQWLELDYTESLSWDLANLTYGGNSTEGKKTVYIECWKEGSVNKSLELDDIVLDNTTPVIHYNYPQPGGTTAWYNTDPSNVIDIDFYWIAHAPLDYAKYRIGNNPWVEIFTENRFSDCTLNWNVSWGLLNEGENQISIRVADCAGNFLEHDYNYTLGKGFIFRKDTKAPLAPNLFVPANGTTINYTEVAFSWESANDSLPSSGIAKYIIEIYDIYDIEQPSYRYDVYTNHITQNLTDGTYYWRIRAVDNANNFGNWSPMFNFILDTLAPKNIIFLINGGATETSSEEVYLIIYAENTDRIRLWNEGSVEPTTWMNYTTFLNWTLAEVPYNASEERTVWLKCLNNKTNRSANKYASILVNKITPWVRIKDHARFINATQFTLYWEPFVDLDFIKKFEILEEGKESWVDVEKNLSFTFYGLSQGYHNFYVRATDVGDRVGAPNSTFICVDLLPPTSLSLIVNEGAGYTNSTSAVLDINAVENFSVTRQVAGIDKYYISNNGYDWLEYNCTQFPESLVWNLILGIENIDGSKTVYFKVKDRAGNYAIVNATVFLDRLKPTNLKIDLPQTTNSTSIALILFAEDPGIASGLLEMCFSEDGINWGAWINGAWVSNGWVAYSSSYTYKLQNGHDGSKTIYFRVRDRSGNENCTSAQTILDRSPKLKSPINYAIINSNNTLLVWERNTPDIGVYSYIVELDDNIDFVSPESFSVNSTSYLISNLTHNTAYFWRVKMKVNGNESFWSEIWSFIVKFPDLSISEDDISFYPVSIVAVWQEVIINLTVHNIGESNAENIVVNFYQDYPYPMARLLGNGTIELIEKGGVAQISIPAIFTVAAEFTVSVVIDPYNTISEIDKENNFAYRSLKVVSFFDVLPINITVAVGNIIEPSYIFENDTITIIAKIKNQGGDIVIPFTAEFWIGKFENGFFNGTLAGKREIQRIAEGEVISDISIDWVASEVGDFAIRLFLNTTGIFKERADNNELFRNITVYYKTALRLSVLEKSVETETEGEVYYNITIENIGLIQDTYDLTVEGLPSDWNYSIIYEGNEIDSITLDVAKSLQIQLRIKTTKEPLGDNKFKFTATSRKDPRAIYELELITKLVAPPPPPLVPPSFPWYLVILGIISAIIISTSPWIVLKVVRKTAKIDEIFLLYSDGRL